MAGARAMGAVGRGWGSSNAGFAGRRSRVCVGSRCSPCRPHSMGDPVARSVRGQAFLLLQLPSSRGLPGSATRCCRECAGVGAQHCPLGLHALLGLRAAGAVGGRSWGGWPAIVVSGVWCQAPSLPRPLVLWGGLPAFRDPCGPGAVGAGVGDQHRPHSVRPCGPALLAVGVAEGRPWGDTFRLCEGRLRSGAPPSPAACLSGRLSGSATHLLWARLRGCGGPALSPWLVCPVGAACRGAGGRTSDGGWPALVSKSVWCQALSFPWPPILWGG